MRPWLWNGRDRAANSPQPQTKLLRLHALSIYLQQGHPGSACLCLARGLRSVSGSPPYCCGRSEDEGAGAGGSR